MIDSLSEIKRLNTTFSTGATNRKTWFKFDVEYIEDEDIIYNELELKEELEHLGMDYY
mgnify:FL=1